MPTASSSVAALAQFLRDRLADLTDGLTENLSGAVTRTVAATLRTAPGAEIVTTLRGHERRVDTAVLSATREFASTVVGATAPFAGSPYARMRLIRQLHASGLLTAEQALRIDTALRERELDVDTVAAPHHPRPGAARSC